MTIADCCGSDFGGSPASQDLGLEFLQADRQHVGPFQQRLVAVRDRGEIEIGSPPLQYLEAARLAASY